MPSAARLGDDARLEPADGGAGEAPRGLDATWDVAYWSTYALTWIVLPLHQCYVDAADFSSVGRLKRAARENAMFLGIAATAMFVGAAALLATESLSLDAMRAYGIVVANVWGISAKHRPQKVGKEHVLSDEDVVQIVKKI